LPNEKPIAEKKTEEKISEKLKGPEGPPDPRSAD